MRRAPRSRVSPPTLRTFHMSSLIMIMRHQLHLHESRGMITPMMTHQPGATTRAGIDLHLGQTPKLGGEVRRWFTHLQIIFCRSFVYPCFAFFIVLILISSFQNTKRPKIFLLFLFLCLFSFLRLVCFTCYFWFGIWKIQKYFTLFAISFRSCFKNRKPKNICCSSSVL
jgi:hypothetical protein